MSQVHFPFDFGDEAEDAVSGFKGVVIAMTEWINGCQRITIQPKGLDKDKKMREAQTIDSQQLKLVKRAAVVLPKRLVALEPVAVAPRARTGGPTLAPTRNADPGRHP